MFRPPLEYKNKKNAQDAHEAVRPTSTEFTPERVKPFLDADQFKLYELIWKRYLACQMEQAIFDQTTVELRRKRLTARITVFARRDPFSGSMGFWRSGRRKTRTTRKRSLGEQLPDLTDKSAVSCLGVSSEKHMTQPPPRYSESSLIKELEEKGIGRPSTYASILSTIQDRKYVEKKENRFYPTELGDLVTELLVVSFPNIVDVQFTANMEEQLDQIEEGTRNWVATLKSFYDPFAETLEDGGA